MRKRIFIASSTRSLPLASALGTNLQGRGYSVTRWTEAFLAGRTTIDELVRQVKEHDYGVFVFGHDDQLVASDPSAASIPMPRDNVVFECGMFLGHKGKEFAFIAVPSTAFQENYKIASDLRGVTVTTYDMASWTEGRVAEAVIRTCDEIHEAIAAPLAPLAWMDGFWVSRFRFESSERRSSRSRRPRVLEQFNVEEVTAVGDSNIHGFNSWCLNQGGPEGFKHRYTARLHHRIVYGTWENLDRAHFGNFQLSVKRNSTRMNGTWTGNGSSGRIETGAWDWCKLEDLTPAQVAELKAIRVTWSDERGRALAQLIEPAETRKISGAELLACLR